MAEFASTLALAIGLGLPAAFIYAGLSSANIFFAKAIGARGQFYILAISVFIGGVAAIASEMTKTPDQDWNSIGSKFGPVFFVLFLTAMPGLRIEGRAAWRDDGGGFKDWFAAFLPLIAFFQLVLTAFEFAIF